MDNRKLNVACIFDGYLEVGGGFQTQLRNLKELKKIENANFIIFVFRKENQEILKNFGFNVVFFKSKFLDKVVRFILRNEISFIFTKKFKLMTKFEKHLKKYNIDLVYFMSPNPLALDLVNHNYIFTVWDLCHRDFCEFPEVNFYREFELRELVYTKALKKAIAVISDSDLGKQNIIRRYGVDENRVYVANFLPSVNVIMEGKENKIDIKKKYGIDSDYIYYPAQFWSHKNHVYIIDALYLLKKEGLRINAVFSGADKGNLDYVFNYAKKLGVHELVKYIGFAPNEEIYYLYKQALALVMPTYFGPTNIPPLEAFAVGTPVIYSDLPGLREQVGDAALLCDLKDPKSLASHIKLLYYNKEKRDILVKKGYEKLKELEKNSIVNVLKRIIDDYSVKLKCWKI